MTDQLVVRTYILYVYMLTDPKSFCDQPDVLRSCFRATTVVVGLDRCNLARQKFTKIAFANRSSICNMR